MRVPRKSNDKSKYIAYSRVLKDQEADLRGDYQAYCHLIDMKNPDHAGLAESIAATLKDHFFEWFLSLEKSHKFYDRLSRLYDEHGAKTFFDLLGDFRRINQYGRAVNEDAFRQDFQNYVINKLVKTCADDQAIQSQSVPIITNASELIYHPVAEVRPESLFTRFLNAIGRFFRALCSCCLRRQESHDVNQPSEPSHKAPSTSITEVGQGSSSTGYLARLGMTAGALDAPTPSSAPDVQVSQESSAIHLDDLHIKSAGVVPRRSW